MNPYFRPAPSARRQRGDAGAYKDFDATELFCPQCRRAVPVRKRLLLEHMACTFMLLLNAKHPTSPARGRTGTPI
jgi:hypothetical protein